MLLEKIIEIRETNFIKLKWFYYEYFSNLSKTNLPHVISLAIRNMKKTSPL